VNGAPVGGTGFDQQLNTTDNVQFNVVSTPLITAQVTTIQADVVRIEGTLAMVGTEGIVMNATGITTTKQTFQGNELVSRDHVDISISDEVYPITTRLDSVQATVDGMAVTIGQIPAINTNINGLQSDLAIERARIDALAGGTTGSTKTKIFFDRTIDFPTSTGGIWSDGTITIGWAGSNDIYRSQLMVNSAPTIGNVAVNVKTSDQSDWDVTVNTYGVNVVVASVINTRAVQQIWIHPLADESISEYCITIFNLPRACFTVETW
jgi:hypothetical protein